MSQLKEQRRLELIYKRGFPYPWDFWLSSESVYAGKDYEQYWEDKEIGTTPPAEDPNFYYPEDCAYIQGEMDELERMEYEYNLMEWEKQYN